MFNDLWTKQAFDSSDKTRGRCTDKKSFAKEVYRIVKKGGKILVIDWTDSFRSMGPHPESIVVRDVAKKLFEECGFKFEKDIESGEHHYGIILRKI